MESIINPRGKLNQNGSARLRAVPKHRSSVHFQLNRRARNVFMAQLLKPTIDNAAWRTSALVLVTGLLFVAAQGCGKSTNPNRLPVFPVKGHLSINGQVPAGAFVALHP